MSKNYLFTSESVSEGHPDKVADQISDAILDAILAKDKDARVACETTVTTGLVLVVGEISTSAYVDIQSVVRKTITDIGYDGSNPGFDGNSCAVLVALDEQSPDIAQGVDDALEQRDNHQDVDPLDQIGAGDQGFVFGFATNETKEFMPLPISLAHKLMRKTAEVRKNGTIDYLMPDAKSQVTIEYDGNDHPVRVDTIVISTQHKAEASLDQVKKDIKKYVIDEVVPANMIDDKTKILINPTGRFVIGGQKEILDLQDVKLSWILMVALLVMVVVLFLVKMLLKLIVQQVTLQDISQRTLLQQALLKRLKFKLHMLLVLPDLYQFMLIHLVLVTFQKNKLKKLSINSLTYVH